LETKEKIYLFDVFLNFCHVLRLELWNARRWDKADWVYKINPTGDNEFEVYCDMTTDWGGWTLIANIDDSSLTTWEARNYTNTWTTKNVFSQNWYSYAYNKLKLWYDFRMDIKNSDIMENNQDWIVLIDWIHSSTYWKTLYSIWNWNTPTFLEKEDNSNIRILKEPTNPSRAVYS